MRSFSRTFWTQAAVQRFRAICMWKSLDASPGKSSTCSCAAPAFITPLKEHPRWESIASLIVEVVWSKLDLGLVSCLIPQFVCVCLRLLCISLNHISPPSQPPQEPRHLQVLSDLEDSNVFTVITGRKLHNAPTDYQFCIKVTHRQTTDCK